MDSTDFDENRLPQSLIRAHFGSQANEYLESNVHSSEKSLARLVDIIQPKSHWKALDVATGAGHTGLAFARIVSQVTAIDLTRPMLLTAQEQEQVKQRPNFDVCQAAAEDLPIKNGSFDLITCRLAAHHFSSVGKFLADATRSLNSGGILAVVDNVVPGGFSERKRSKQLNKPDHSTGRYINAFERLRDPGHHRCLSLEEWVEGFYSAGIRLLHSETVKKELVFDSWAARSRTTSVDIIRLKAMLIQAPPAAKDILDPLIDGGELKFHLTEAIIVGIKES